MLNRVVPIDNQQLAFTLGGPIMRDKLHFFFFDEYERAPKTEIWNTPFPKFNVALDGTGRNSPFAGALVKQLNASNDDVGAILISVRNDVMKATDRKQVPWEHSALTGRFFFNPPAPAPAAAPAPAPAMHLRSSEAAEAWNATKDTTNVAVLGAFVARYRDTFYAELARARIEELRK